MPKELVLAISVLVGLAIVARAILVLYSVARVMCHVVVRREETGNTFRPCKIFKVLDIYTVILSDYLSD